MVNWTQYQKVALDTNCFIYMIEGSPYETIVRSLFKAIEEGHVLAVCSVLTITELLTGPCRSGDARLWEEYRAALYRFPNLSFHPIDIPIAEGAAQLRGKYRIKSPDAIHLSTAMLETADVFITNDKELSKCDFPVIILSDIVSN